MKCSTPCGINEVVTTQGEALCPRTSGAQRLAASTKLSPQPEYENPKPSQVLNALRHQRSCHQGPGPPKTRALFVLNALRHQRSCHFPWSSRRVSYSLRAQRLAASTKLSPAATRTTCVGVAGAQRLAASTKLSHRKSSAEQLDTIVLNALRHQRSCHPDRGGGGGGGAAGCSTPCGINEVVTPRLPSPVLLCPFSAQRLAASTKLSRRGDEPQFTTDSMCSTPCGINEVVTWPPAPRRRVRFHVLNALRHQRSCHHTYRVTWRAIPMCSTPCGINEVVTRRPLDNPISARVLNALRHQRSCHRVETRAIRAGRMCSTPCGINEVVTF